MGPVFGRRVDIAAQAVRRYADTVQVFGRERFGQCRLEGFDSEHAAPPVTATRGPAEASATNAPTRGKREAGLAKRP